jgi:hypothetical protein
VDEQDLARAELVLHEPGDLAVGEDLAPVLLRAIHDLGLHPTNPR